MLKNIIVECSASENMEQVLAFSSKLSSSLRGCYVKDYTRLYYVSAAQLTLGSMGVAPIVPQPLAPQDLLKEQELMEKEAQQAESVFKKTVSGEFETLTGVWAQVMADQARTADLVVLSSHMGSHSDARASELRAYLHEAVTPSLLLPESFSQATSLVIAYDGSHAAERVLRQAAGFASLLGIESVKLITISRTAEKADHIQASAIRYLQPYCFELETHWQEGETTEELIEFTGSSSLLALGAFAHGNVKEYFLGTTSLDVLARSEIAVLTMR